MTKEKKKTRKKHKQTEVLQHYIGPYMDSSWKVHSLEITQGVCSQRNETRSVPRKEH